MERIPKTSAEPSIYFLHKISTKAMNVKSDSADQADGILNASCPYPAM